jgi:hypothetical protein
MDNHDDPSRTSPPFERLVGTFALRDFAAVNHTVGGFSCDIKLTRRLGGKALRNAAR